MAWLGKTSRRDENNLILELNHTTRPNILPFFKTSHLWGGHFFTGSFERVGEEDESPSLIELEVQLSITTTNNSTIIHAAFHRLPDYCSVYQAELTAMRLREACNPNLEETKKNIIIWTNSLSSLMVIKSNNIRSRTVADCLDAIRNIATATTVELR